MKADRFISEKISFKGKMAMGSIAISFLIIIIAVSIASGFRREIRKGISEVCADIQLSITGADNFTGTEPISQSPSYLEKIREIDGVEEITPVIYRAGIIRCNSEIQGALLKGTARTDTTTLGVSIPKRLAVKMGIGPGDRMPVYFVSETIKARTFTVSEIYDSVLGGDDEMIVKADIEDLRRVNDWEEGQVSALEISLSDRFSSRRAMKEKAADIGSVALMYALESDDNLVASSAVDRYASVFDWLRLIDTNVVAILVLMIIVAGFNMISGLLIMLFRSISTIGILKAMGMTDRGIAAVFLRISARATLKGMLAGNTIALLFCFLQKATHFMKLNPENYFVSFVPVSIDLPGILIADAAAFTAIMLLLLLPCLFISRVDPAETVKVR